MPPRPPRPVVVSVVLLGLALVVGARAGAEEPAAPALQQSPTEARAAQLAEGLLATSPATRAAAEAGLAEADAPVARALALALRRRLDAVLRPAAPAPQGVAFPDVARRVVTVRTWVVEATASAATALVGHVPTGPDGLKRFEPAAFEALLRAAESGSGLRIATSPVVTTHLGQKATLAVEEQTAYVGDIELSERAGRRIAEPVVETVSHGLRLEVTPTLLGASLKLDVAVEQSALTRPMATWQGKVFDGTLDVSLQLPELSSTRWSRRVVLEPGVAVLLAGAGGAPGPGGLGLLVFVEARVGAAR